MEGRLLSRAIIIVMRKLNILLEQLKKKNNYSESELDGCAHIMACS